MLYGTGNQEQRCFEGLAGEVGLTGYPEVR